MAHREQPDAFSYNKSNSSPSLTCTNQAPTFVGAEEVHEKAKIRSSLSSLRTNKKKGSSTSGNFKFVKSLWKGLKEEVFTDKNASGAYGTNNHKKTKVKKRSATNRSPLEDAEDALPILLQLSHSMPQHQTKQHPPNANIHHKSPLIQPGHQEKLVGVRSGTRSPTKSRSVSRSPSKSRSASPTGGMLTFLPPPRTISESRRREQGKSPTYKRSATVPTPREAAATLRVGKAEHVLPGLQLLEDTKPQQSQDGMRGQRLSSSSLFSRSSSSRSSKEFYKMQEDTKSVHRVITMGTRQRRVSRRDRRTNTPIPTSATSAEPQHPIKQQHKSQTDKVSVVATPLRTGGPQVQHDHVQLLQDQQTPLGQAQLLDSSSSHHHDLPQPPQLRRRQTPIQQAQPGAFRVEGMNPAAEEEEEEEEQEEEQDPIVMESIAASLREEPLPATTPATASSSSSSGNHLPQAKAISAEVVEKESNFQLKRLQEEYMNQQNQFAQMQKQLQDMESLQKELQLLKGSVTQAEPVVPTKSVVIVPTSTTTAAAVMKEMMTNKKKNKKNNKKEQQSHRHLQQQQKEQPKLERPKGMNDMEWNAYQFLVGM